MSLPLMVLTIGVAGQGSRKIEATRYRVHQSGALEIFGVDNRPLLLVAAGAWTDVAISTPC